MVQINRLRRDMKAFRKNILMILLFCSVFVANAQELDSLWFKANDAYAMGEYGNAAEDYSLIEKEGYGSSGLFYNMGNVYYKQGNIAKAILYYERALKLDPSGKDIKTNLEIARLNTLDKIDVLPEFILTTWVKDLRNMMSSNKWGYTAMILLAVTALLMIGYNFAPTSGQRKFSFVLACVAMLFVICSVFFAVNLRVKAGNKDFAVVMAPVSNIKSAPNLTGNNLFILHEGAKIQILEQVSGWSRIELSDGRQGWIQAADMEVI